MSLCKHDGAVKAGAGVYNCKAVAHNRMKCDILFPEDRIHFKKLRGGGGGGDHSKIQRIKNNRLKRKKIRKVFSQNKFSNT